MEPSCLETAGRTAQVALEFLLANNTILWRIGVKSKRMPHEPRSALQPGRISRREWLRFCQKFQVTPDGHWAWNGSRDKDGYGRHSWRGEVYGAHRFCYIALGGVFPPKLEPDHLCRIPSCINPSCLDLVTTKVNVLRGEGITARNARKTACLHGHVFTKKSTRISICRMPNGSPYSRRTCRICVVEERRRRRLRLKQT